MRLRRLFHVLVIGAGALVSGACATTSAASQSSEAQRPSDGSTAQQQPQQEPYRSPAFNQGSGAPAGW